MSPRVKLGHETFSIARVRRSGHHRHREVTVGAMPFTKWDMDVHAKATAGLNRHPVRTFVFDHGTRV